MQKIGDFKNPANDLTKVDLISACSYRDRSFLWKLTIRRNYSASSGVSALILLRNPSGVIISDPPMTISQFFRSLVTS
jgi:hypothetical protein